MRKLSILFSCVCLLASHLRAAPFPPPLRVPDAIGVNIHFTHAQPGEMEMLADAGFRWVRMDFAWSAIEKTNGQYDFSEYDHLLKICDKHHIRLMAILDYSNPLYDNNASPHTDEGIAAFAKWAAASVKHFKGRGILWEMYNEPNGFWRPQPDVNAYVKLALAVAKAIKVAAPNEVQCGPGLAGTDQAWLEPCFKAGLLEYWDAVSVHPYGEQPPETRDAQYKAVRELIERYRPKGKTIPVLSGEWGFTAAHVSREIQGKFLARQLLFNISSGIPLSIWYDWHDDGPNPKDGEHNFGLVAHPYRTNQQPVFEPKPAYLAARTLTSRLNGFNFSKRITLADPADFFLLFTKGRETRAVAWTTSTKPRVVTIPSSSGSYSVESFDGQALPAIDAGDNGLAIELTDGPKYLSPKSRGNPWKM